MSISVFHREDAKAPENKDFLLCSTVFIVVQNRIRIFDIPIPDHPVPPSLNSPRHYRCISIDRSWEMGYVFLQRSNRSAVTFAASPPRYFNQRSRIFWESTILQRFHCSAVAFAPPVLSGVEASHPRLPVSKSTLCFSPF